MNRRRMSAEVVEALTALGFSLNEGRAYTALLLYGPQTGYEVGQRAEVPRSAVYGALRKLVAVGAARSIAGSPERFVAAPPDVVVGLLKRRFSHEVQALETSLASLEATPEVPDAFSVRGYERVIEEADRLVRSAKTRVVMSGWPREVAMLRDALADARERKVRVVMFSHSALPEDLPGQHFSYGHQESDLEQFWRHRLVLVVDDRRTLIGATERLPGDHAVLSEMVSIAEVATSQIALDITLLAQREKIDVEDTMAEMLGDRVGRLDTLPKARAVVGRRA